MAENRNIEQHLKGINYPVQKNELVNQVRQKGASDDVVRKIEQLPQDRFQSQQEVMQNLDRV